MTSYADRIGDYLADPANKLTYHTRAALHHAAHLADTLAPDAARDAAAWLENVYRTRVGQTLRASRENAGKGNETSLIVAVNVAKETAYGYWLAHEIMNGRRS